MGVTESVAPFLLQFGGETMVKVNGEDKDLAGMTLMQYLASTQYDVRRIAIERNGDIVPRADYDKITLSDGDRLEIVCFVGGG